ncbi:hypothetical protein CPB85DRAFT_1430527 [Mucidula mucida]|nr:hypothetical protein CPB85DRAFT_1430527 [Mucidula mucida]
MSKQRIRKIQVPGYGILEVEEAGMALQEIGCSSSSDWDWLKRWEEHLPQHDLHVSAPDGATGRYVRFSNQAQNLGWNNILNEILMNAHLAHASGRGYVFSDYVWAGHHYPWSFSDKEKSQRQWPPHTPLNALMSGPSLEALGMSTIQHRVLYRLLGLTSYAPRGATWADFLRTAPERCIDIVPSSDDGFPQIFDIWLWGNTRLLPLWDSFSSSPVSRLLAASPIVNAAVDRNEYLFLPRTPRPAVKAGASPYDRVLSLHIRRGDYEGACKHFATWSSTFYGWNQLEFLPDRFIPPPGAGWGTNTPENFEIICVGVYRLSKRWFGRYGMPEMLMTAEIWTLFTS